MKAAPLPLVALTLALSALHSAALDLQPGQSIGVDFGATPPTNHFNPFDPSNPATPADGILSTVMDTTGATLSGIGISFGGSTAQSVAATTQDLAHTPDFDTSNIEDAVTGYNLTMTFTGLTPGQAFTLSAVSSYTGFNIGTEFFWGTQSILTDSTSTTGGTLAQFSNITADANGRITLAAFGHESLHGPSWSGVNAALLTAHAIPEPSTFLLVGMAGLAFSFRRRWMSASKIRSRRHPSRVHGNC